MSEEPLAALAPKPMEGPEAWALLGAFAGHVHVVADRFTRIRFVTPNVEGLLGTPATELLGTSMFDLYHDEDLARIGDGFEAALYRGELVLARHRCQTPKGDVWVESTSRAVASDGDTVVLISLRREPGNPAAAWTSA